MDFAAYLVLHNSGSWADCHVNYTNLAQAVAAEPDPAKCAALVEKECEQLHKFAEAQGMPTGIGAFLAFNYMTLFRAVGGPTRKARKAAKVTFFRWLKQQDIFQRYISLPRTLVVPVELVVFDKDGTLINHELIFGPWVEQLIAGMKDIVPLEVDGMSVWKGLGYDKATQTFEGNSVVCAGTYDDIRDWLCNWILKSGTSDKDADQIWDDIVRLWTPPECEPQHFTVCGDLTNVFNMLKAKGTRIAVCTSDDRADTLKTLEYLGLHPDKVRCGDDALSSKPSPEPLWDICQQLGVHPSRAVMIGDTLSDIRAGRNAQFGRVVGVLSGGYTNTDLAEADVVLKNVDELLALPLWH